MTLALFDLDNTLIAGDSDHSWGEFVVEHGLVEAQSYRQANDRFYQDYQDGTLDMRQYAQFALAPLRHFDARQRQQLHQQFMAEKILPLMLPKAQALIASHRQRGHTLMIITATNDFITAPIAKHLEIPHLLATEAEQVNGKFSGGIVGEPCFQQGKVHKLQQWLQGKAEPLQGSFFYSDSFNDLPLLAQVTHPYAVDPDDRLKAHAQRQQWPIISLR